jgi:diguanylate cyclase (GGDEF)-like protein
MNVSNQKILIVDDISANIIELNEILQEKYEVYLATNGLDCLEIAKSNKPDLILLDVIMPEMDGYEVCRRLKNIPDTRDIPVILVTNMDEVEDEAKGLEIGAIDYITKPIRPAILKARLKNHLDLKRCQHMLRNLSSLDDLTGIANRRRFDEVMDIEWRRALRSGDLLSVIMIDVDYFNNYNNLYDRTAVDTCLQKVVKAINNTVKRAGDMVARYGGEKFSVMLPMADAANAYSIAELIRSNVESLRIPHQSSEISDWVTVSVGVSTAAPQLYMSINNLIEKADQALYQAKQEGRNRVIVV